MHFSPWLYYFLSHSLSLPQLKSIIYMYPFELCVLEEAIVEQMYRSISFILKLGLCMYSDTDLVLFMN